MMARASFIALAILAGGCAGAVEQPSTLGCPDGATPRMSCDLPLSMGCIVEPSVRAASGGLCVLELDASCTSEVHYHLLYELEQSDAASWTAKVKLFASQCVLETP
jgi:hypothetical protein